ncbi:MAG TPA: DUF6485 family protein [Halanaerobiales bacterium]|nr:DUF6485 family protein [Halanaerobiales bacterium]
MANCQNHQANMDYCNCTYEPCPRKGKCCECIRYHKKMGELPACFFPDEAEKTYDRSIEHFVEIHS